jgi:hypothetical protein
MPPKTTLSRPSLPHPLGYGLGPLERELMPSVLRKGIDCSEKRVSSCQRAACSVILHDSIGTHLLSTPRDFALQSRKLAAEHLEALGELANVDRLVRR